MKNILIVTYVFPPYVAVGGYRIIKFCKYLPQFGYNPVILTPQKPNTRAYDENLLHQVDSQIKIYRTPLYEPFRWKPDNGGKTTQAKQSSTPKKHSPENQKSLSFLKKIKRTIKQNISIPDSSLFWVMNGFKDGIKAVQSENIDIILSSSPPQSVHLLANRLARKTNIPNILDFRDLWTQNTSYAEKNLPDYLLKRDRKYEKKVLSNAAGIIVNTDTFKNQLLENNSYLDTERIQTVTNGVDPDDFTQYLKDSEANDKFTMLYSGSLYGSHRNPDFFLAAIKEWIDTNPDIRNKIRIEFIGNKTLEYEQMVQKFGLEGVVEGVEWMPQKELFERMMVTDLLLLFQGFDPVLNAAIPRKLYEYMITNKDILAFAPEGEIPKLISDYRCGLCLSDRNPKPIISYLSDRFKKWSKERKQGSTSKGTLRSMTDLETKNQVKKLADLCNTIVI